MITVKVNDTNKIFSKETTIDRMIETLQIQSNGIAIAINNSIIKKSDWENHILSDNDNVLIIRSTQGG
ncbi:sulfur carrier protein ThiS [uncultured Tenacibaculum sp.]|uniref:sulfur carrier protein ThiS n=1 Tax=uncultured Tenacibaculum sp. TaxID=174713 RepID=UPI0026248BA5|nr:sulfur carrier protein ThiS [uncultured Tenacibaculum sp.]